MNYMVGEKDDFNFEHKKFKKGTWIEVIDDETDDAIGAQWAIELAAEKGYENHGHDDWGGDVPDMVALSDSGKVYCARLWSELSPSFHAAMEGVPDTAPIRCFKERPSNGMDGWDGPGWYFWGEKWEGMHGPFSTKEEAEHGFMCLSFPMEKSEVKP